MPKGDKTPASYDKTTVYYIKKGDKEWAKASSDPSKAYRYKYARDFYTQAKKVLKAKVERYELPEDENTLKEIKKLIKQVEKHVN